jgi:hypothetical protein
MIGRMAACVVAAVSPPGPNKENRKTGQNSEANRPSDRIEDLYVRRMAEDQQQEDTGENDSRKKFL